MKSAEILPDNINELQRNGVTLRKGSVAAFMTNIKIIEDPNTQPEQEQEAVTDLIELIPVLKELGFFDLFSIKSKKVSAIIKGNFSDLP